MRASSRALEVILVAVLLLTSACGGEDAPTTDPVRPASLPTGASVAPTPATGGQVVEAAAPASTASGARVAATTTTSTGALVAATAGTGAPASPPTPGSASPAPAAAEEPEAPLGGTSSDESPEEPAAEPTGDPGSLPAPPALPTEPIPAPTAGPVATTPTTTGSTRPRPGNGPSELARMVCEEDEVRDAVELYAGEQLVATPTPTWIDHLYTCPYVLPHGTLTLSVKELPDAAATVAYYEGLKAELGHVGRIFLGEEAFATPPGSVVVRKDELVLLIDVTHFADLPAPRSRSEIATNLATVIMACWV